MTNREHNFGVTRYSGARVILRIDFPARTFNVLDRGTKKKWCSFPELDVKMLDGLKFSIGMKNKELFFAADSIEEKNTICDLIHQALTLAEAKAEPKRRCKRIPSLDENQHVIKDGYLEKKGNATIVLWEKRRVKIMAGYFAYYKPKSKNALHIVNVSELTKVEEENCCLKITVKDRVYWFRLLNEQGKPSAELQQKELQEWISAFKWARRGNRVTIREQETGDTLVESRITDLFRSTLSTPEIQNRNEEAKSIFELNQPRAVFSKAFETEIFDALGSSGTGGLCGSGECSQLETKTFDDPIYGQNCDIESNSSDDLYDVPFFDDEPDTLQVPPLPEKKSLKGSDDEESISYDYPASYMQKLKISPETITHTDIEERDRSNSSEQVSSKEIGISETEASYIHYDSDSEYSTSETDSEGAVDNGETEQDNGS